MKNNQLGNSGLHVSELALGTMLFGEDQARSTPEAEAFKIIEAFIASGGNHIDTANVYANGESEKIIGEALKRLGRHKVTLASKARFSTSAETDFGGGLSRKVVKQQIETSLKSLQTDYLDLYYMHGWDPSTPIEESLRVYEDLVKEGKVLYVGVSNFKAWQVMKALSIADRNNYSRYIAAQYQYSLVKRDIDNEYMSLCMDEGLGLMSWGPLGGGFLTGKYRQNETPVNGRIAQSDETVEEAWHRRNTAKNWKIIDVLKEIAAQHNASISQIAIAWLRHHPHIASVLIGPRTHEQCIDNLGSLNISLSSEEFGLLDNASKLEDSYPYSMIKAYGME